MSSLYNFSVVVLFLLILCDCAENEDVWQEFSIGFYVSTLVWSGTPDELYFKICDTDGKCGKFENVPHGWQDEGETYYYTYSALNIGSTPGKVYIVLEGSEKLCLGHIYVNGKKYDEEECWICLDWPNCIEDSGGGCDTMVIDLTKNHWTERQTVPCEFSQDELNSVYTDAPTTNTPTRKPTKRPTRYPSQTPTIRPSKYPSQTPTMRPTQSPTPIPTEQPSETPTQRPTDAPTEKLASTQNPSQNPTESESASVITTEIEIETTDNHIANNNDNENTEQGLIAEGGVNNNDNSDALLVGGLIGGLVFLCLCVSCLLLLIVLFCWRKKKNLNDGIQHVNGESIDVSSVYSEDIEGHGTTTTTKKKGINEQTVLILNSNKEKLQLLNDTSGDDDDEDEDEDVIDGGITNGFDEDENILPDDS